MHHREDPSEQLLRTAAGQGGVISAEQVRSLGFSLRSVDRLVGQRSWQRLADGLYHLGVGDPSWLALAWGAVLLGGPASRLGFEAAGHLWGLLEPAPQTILTLVPHGRPVTDRGPWTFRQERGGARSARSPGSPPRTTVEDTVIDLCDGAATRDLVHLVATAVQSRRTTADSIAQALRTRARVRHRTLLRQLLGDVACGAESALELRYLRDVERAHALPPARRQVRSRGGREVRDLVHEAFGIVIELDGRLHIAGRFKDMARDNAALLTGLLTLRYGWADVTERACQVAWQVATLLMARGWTGYPTRCRWCAHVPEADLP